MGNTQRRPAVIAAVMGMAALAAACVPAPPEPATGTSPNDAPRAAEAAYTEPGPYAVGVTTLSLADRKVEVWYPSTGGAGAPRDTYNFLDLLPVAFRDLVNSIDPTLRDDVNFPDLADPVVAGAVAPSFRDAPAATGPFPLVLFSHGAASYRQQSSFLTTHLASWGFVVASPDYLERGLTGVLGEPPAAARPDTVVAGEAIDLVRNLSAADDGLLSGTVDPTRVFPVGHSAGGAESQRLLSRGDVPSAVSLAAGVSPLQLANMTAPLLPPGKAVAWIGGRNDGISPIDNLRTGFEYTPGERRLVEVGGAGHNNAFTDICTVGGGGVAALARAINLPVPDGLLALGDDGCTVGPFRPSVEVWPEVRHFVTAELRLRSGLDAQPVGLGDQVLPSFDDVLVYRHDP